MLLGCVEEFMEYVLLHDACALDVIRGTAVAPLRKQGLADKDFRQPRREYFQMRSRVRVSR